MSDQRWMRTAIRLAQEARDRGDEPFGALLVVDGEIALTARNAIVTARDLTQHAELRLISKASVALEPAVLETSTLYTSTEPCAMCAGAIYWAEIKRVVFGFPAPALEAMSDGSALRMPVRKVLGNATRSVTIEGPILEAEARSVHEGFW